MRSHQRGALFLLPMLLIGLASAVVLTPTGDRVVALAATNACKSNATATFSDISVGLTGTATPSTATVGTDTITLSGLNLTAAVPATLLIAGYNLGLLAVGANSIPVKGWVSIAGSNTAEGVRLDTFTANVTTTITDPNGLPGTGDETATPLSLNVAMADATFTPTGGNVSFTQGAPGTLPAIPAGQVGAGAVTPVGGIYISAQVAGGLVKANFDCQVGTTIISPPGGTSGTTFTPGTPGAFASVTVVGGNPATTLPPTTAPATTAPATTAPATTAPATTAPATTAVTTTTAPPPVNGTSQYTTSCHNSVTPDLSELIFNASGTAPATVDADTQFKVSKMKWDVTIPATVFQTGINLGVITPGSSLPATLDLAITASHTAQNIQDAAKINLTVPVLTNAQGAALPSTVKFDVPDMTWTALSGSMNFLMYGANVSVKLGALPTPVVFVCKPTKGAAFVSAEAVGVSTITTTTAVASDAPTTTAGGTLVVTGPRGSLWIQLLLGLILLDLGYLTLSLRRSPRRR